MSLTLRTPDERSCELCGRTEAWDDHVGAWRVVGGGSDGDPQVGSLHCIHEWDINGSFAPFSDDRNAAEG